MKLYFNNSKKEEIMKISTSDKLSRCNVKEIIRLISDNLHQSHNLNQIVIDIINGDQVYTVVRQYYKSKPIEFEVTDRIPDEGCSINDSIIMYMNYHNDITYHYDIHTNLIVVIKEIKYTVNSAVYGNELLIDLVPVN